MSQFNTQAEPRSSGSGSYDMKPDPTPYELVVMENDDLRARLQLADERAFEQAATIARLRVGQAELLKSLKKCITWAQCYALDNGIDIANGEGPCSQDVRKAWELRDKMEQKP